jgi:polysaccharide export outer membrane protein
VLKPIALVLATLVGCAALAACNRGPTQQGERVPAVTAVPQRTGSNEYVIGSGDSLSILVYQAPELSDQGITVRPDGKISMPLVQDINAAGLTPPELANDITQRLRQYVKNPIV